MTPTHLPPSGDLAPCPGPPNCVCSESADPRYAIAPLTFACAPEEAHRHLVGVIQALPRSAIVFDDGTHLHATFTSLILRFVDDLELLVVADRKLIQIRSASRLGHYDFGVNRARVEKLRRRFADQASAAR